MGKRKVTQAKEEIGKNDDSNSQLDTILSLLDLCGFYDDKACPRMQLIDSLGALRVRYSRHVWWEETLQMTETVLQEILQLEELMAKVRDLSTQYEEKLDDDFVEFTELRKYAVPASWKYMHMSLCSSYKTQRHMETVALRDLTSTLDRIYIRPDPNEISLDQCLETTIQCLQRYCLLQRVDFREIVSVCNQSFAENQLSHVENGFTATEVECKSEVVAPSKVSQSVTSADKVLDAVRWFLHAPRDTLKNSSLFTTLLVVGPEGSGKTHLCDEVSSLAKETSCQGNYNTRC